jgi:hypothetical protein
MNSDSLVIQPIGSHYTDCAAEGHIIKIRIEIIQVSDLN